MFYLLSFRHNLKDEVRLSLYDECNVWLRHLSKKKTQFLGGSEPNLADLAVFGVLGSIEGCDAFKDLQANTKINAWYNATKAAIASRAGATLK
jgi:microsomal prostaglandin-E synthase 2